MIGICACGCGRQTNKHQSTIRRFVRGHNLRGKNHHAWSGGRYISGAGYVRVQIEQHPRRSSAGYIFEHILVVEKALGRYLPKGAVIHHANGRRAQNNNKNIVLCESRGYHLLIEARTRAFRASGHANYRRCPHCKKWDDPANMYLYKTRRGAYHQDCRRRYQQRRSSKVFASITRTYGDDPDDVPAVRVTLNGVAEDAGA